MIFFTEDGIVAGDVGYDQRQHARLARRRQSAALNAGDVLAHRVHVLNRRAAAQQLPGRRPQFFHGYALGGEAQQARSTAGNQHQQQVVRTQDLHAAQNLLRRLFAALVRDRVPSLYDFDPICQQAVPVTGDDETV